MLLLLFQHISRRNTLELDLMLCKLECLQETMTAIVYKREMDQRYASQKACYSEMRDDSDGLRG